MKKALILSTLIAGTAIFGAGGFAFAQDRKGPLPPQEFGMGPDGPMAPKLEELDANKDGKITRDEVKAKEKAFFAEVDTNKDGFATAEEMTAHHEKKREEMRKKMEAERHQQMLEKLDTNKDGKISEAEFTARPNPRFDMADSNDDGVIDETEMAAIKDRMGDRKGPHDRKEGGFRR